MASAIEDFQDLDTVEKRNDFLFSRQKIWTENIAKSMDKKYCKKIWTK